MVSPEAPKSRLPRRTASAALAGFLTVAAAVALVGPNVNIVLAEEDDRTVYLRILRAEHGRNFPRPTPAAQPIAPLPQAQRGLFQIPVRGPLRAILVPREDKRLNYQAYAPTRHPIVAGPFKADPFHAPAAREPRALRPVSAPPLAHSAIRSVTPAGIIPSGGDGQASLSRRSVCVRLCDGFFFPVGAYNGPQDNEAHGAVCAGLCPGAPTRLYVAAAGSEKIEDAVSVRDGRRYSALPVALRHAARRDDTCSCRGPADTVAQSVSLLRDFTLRRGDRVMTSRGFRIFRGEPGLRHDPAQFTALASASGLSERERVSLRAMELATGYTPPRQATARAIADGKPLQMSPAPARFITDSAGKSVRMIGPQAMLREEPAIGRP